MNATERLQREMERITRMQGDPEGFHWEQDRFLVRVLRLIAKGTLEGEDARVAARIAADLATLKATRWYA